MRNFRFSSISLFCIDLAKVLHTGLFYKYYSLSYLADNDVSDITLDQNSI